MSLKKRHYDDACAATHAIDMLGQRWVLPIMRELMLGPKRFTDLKSDLRAISANVLTQRLEMMEERGVIARVRLEPPAAAQAYGLTAWGYQAAPIFQTMARWGARSPEHDPAAPMSATSLVLSLRSMIDAERATGFCAIVGLDLGRETFTVDYRSGAVAIARRTLPQDLDASITADPDAVAALVHRAVPLGDLEAQGRMAVAGDRFVIERMATLYPPCERAQLPPE